ncbi:Cytosolic Fe-S cluster assembly factor nar1 [Loxospora ochrophaea]|nr:Cytosolic Fe-S cluster assembly factor nar1 [Loxospora ochrophaea]
MSAILSADDLNDFISPGVACIKPVETLPLQKPGGSNNDPYEVTTEDKLPVEAPPAQISLTDCLACSGCVTSAEAVLVSLQSHTEVLNALDSSTGSTILQELSTNEPQGVRTNGHRHGNQNEKLFVASISPQVRASLAATYKVSEEEAGWMIEQLLSGPHGLKAGGRYGNGFTWVIDTNAMREACLVAGADEVLDSTVHPSVAAGLNNEASLQTSPQRPILTSACPGWICYAEKTHPHVLPHLSRLKSPQALTGTLLKTILSKHLNISPSQIWHLAIMPCFDKKLEASREELTDIYWRPTSSTLDPPTRDVDCVITARELLMLADTRGISFPSLPRKSLSSASYPPFPDPILSTFIFPRNPSRYRPRRVKSPTPAAGSSGGYLYYILRTYQAQHPGSTITITRGRNADVTEYTLLSASPESKPLFRAARYYGFRNIQNLVRRLKPTRMKTRFPGGAVKKPSRPQGASSPAIRDSERDKQTDFAYVEVMACPGGCTNGGGQIKVDDLGASFLQRQGRHLPTEEEDSLGAMTQKEWLQCVDEAYYSGSESSHSNEQSNDDDDDDDEMEDVPSSSRPAADDDDDDVINGISPKYIHSVLSHWSAVTDIPLEKLLYTTYRAVESDVGKKKGVGDTERVAELAGRIGGGW